MKAKIVSDEIVIPSGQLRDYFNEIDFTFSNCEKATILWNAPNRKWYEKIDLLKQMAVQIADRQTREQIEERLRYEERKLEAFYDNPDKKYVYVVEDQTYCSYGYFREGHMAVNFAVQNVTESGESLYVDKMLLVSGDMEETEADCLPVAHILVDSEGDISSLWSSEVKEDIDLQEGRFENRFVKIPIPYLFKRGCPVKYLPTGEYGVIATTKAEMDDLMDNISVEARNCVDYGDMSIVVVFPTEKGCWSHRHINPLYLEVDFPESCEKNHALCCALEALSDYWSKRGREDIVLRYSRKYAESCRQKSPVENATRLQDIIF